MSGVILRFMGFMSVLSGLPSRGHWFKGALAALVRLLCLLGWTALTTFLLASWTNSLIDPKAVRSQLEVMVGTDFSALKDDLGGTLSLSLLALPDGTAFAVRTEIDSVERPAHTGPVCATAISKDTLCLFRVDNALAAPVDWLSESTWLPESASSWRIFRPFEAIAFPSTAYSISEVALEVAAQNPDITFTRSKADQLRAAIEQRMEANGIFLPTDPALLLARQLNGSIQFATYALGFWSIGIMLFLALGSLLPNAVVRLFDQVELNEADSRDPPPPEPQRPAGPAQDGENTQTGAQPGNDAQHDAEGNGPPDGNGDEEKIETHILKSPTPWSPRFGSESTIDLTNEQQIARYYESVSDYFRSRSLVLGTVIDPPILRFRTAATRAVANTGDTSILPSFLDAQRNSIDGFYDARLSAVKFLLWVIPTIGFIGTIIGVSQALSSTIGLQAARDLTSATSQSQVSASMGMAFDTTLVALVVAVVVMLLYHSLQGSEERMTVLERNRAEDEVLKMVKFIRKPGDTIDLAQQLIALGVNTEVLVRDLELFQKTGPDLARTIEALRRREQELAAIVEVRRNEGIRAGGWNWIWLLLLLALLFGLLILASQGVLGLHI